MNKNSVFGNRWEILSSDATRSMFFIQNLGISHPVATCLATNPCITIQEAKNFLSPSVKNLMPNPFESFLDMETAVLRIMKAIFARQKIVIFGDYDVDGATSCAIFRRFFAKLEISAEIYIPDRVKEGYGPNSNALLELHKNGADLVITVDCGTVAFEPLQKASEAGLEIIVIDHHLGVKEKPKSIAVINPNRFDETSDLTYLCGAGVSFMLVVALNMALKKNDYYVQNKIKEPNLISFLDLVALGTVCDIMPLVGLNRAFVKTGIEVIKAKTNLGIKTLLGVAGSETEITEFTLGFILGPRINAGGRIGKSTLGATLLSTENEKEAFEIANELNELNSTRKGMEEASLSFAIQKVESEGLWKNDVIFVEDEAFHQGIIGILASRIKDRYNKPVAVFSRLDGYLKASFRSISGLDIGELIHKANSKGMLIAGGGHAMAGGLSVLEGDYEKLFKFFNEEVSKSTMDFQKTIHVAGVISIDTVSPNLCLELKKLSPFGNANPKPIFCIKNVIVIKCDILKEAHVSFILKDSISGKTLKAMFFRASQLGILPNLNQLLGKEVDVLGELELNEWNGARSAVLHLVDVAY